LILITAIAVVPRADALRAARPYCATSVPPLPPSLPRTGALLVTSTPCDESSSRLRTITSVFGGAPEALAEETLAPGLHRHAPTGGFAPGVHTIEGLSRTPHGLSITDVDGTPPVAPSVRALTRSSRRVRVESGRGDPTHTDRVTTARITMRLRSAVPDGVVAIAVRWIDWTDPDGGVYGAWTRVTPGEQTFVLVCTVEDGCGRTRGHLPRRNERFVARYVDASGQVSAPSVEGTVPGAPPTGE
jgi:hypothetical protein